MLDLSRKMNGKNMLLKLLMEWNIYKNIYIRKNEMTIIVGLTGKQRNGKSYFCKMLYNKFNEQTTDPISGIMQDRVVQLNFKDALIDLAQQIGWNGKKDEKGRRFLQLLGTDCIRNCIDKDYWIKKWKICAEGYSRIESIDLILADDVRFNNEARAIKDLNGFIIEVVTPAQNKGPTDPHISEAGIDRKFINQKYVLKFGLDYIQAAVEHFYEHYITKKNVTCIPDNGSPNILVNGKYATWNSTETIDEQLKKE
jgi:hypothetical protein